VRGWKCYVRAQGGCPAAAAVNSIGVSSISIWFHWLGIVCSSDLLERGLLIPFEDHTAVSCSPFLSARACLIPMPMKMGVELT